MAITLGSNIPSLQAQRRLGDASASTSKLFEQLSSGLRINRASDDAAGLAIADDLNSKTRVYSRAILNVSDGQSVLAIADSTLSDLSGIVTRIRELSEQSANGTYSNQQRKALDTEAQALAREFFRVSRATSFNKINLFDGTLSDGIRFQLGYGSDGSLQSRIGGNLGTGTFNTATSYSTESSQSNGVATGDLNGDGILDLVTAGLNASDGYATVRLGQGDGTFGSATSYLAENGGGVEQSSAVVLGDLNGDGILDMVTTGTVQFVSGFATIRLGVGDGTFGAAVSYATDATTSSAVTLADLNNDGSLDLLTSGSGGGAGSATIRFGTGNGTFGAATSYVAESASSSSIKVGDLNGDGILDLVTAGTGSGPAGGQVTVRLGTGNGQFGSSTNYSSETFGGVGSSSGLALGDLNGDGILDIVTVGNANRNGYATVRLGSASGTFGAAVSYLVGGSSANAIKLADLNGDGNLDLAVGFTNAASTSNLKIALGTGTGTFGTFQTFASANSIITSIDVADLDGDGVLDAITAGSNGVAGTASIMKGQTRDGISPLVPFSLLTKADSLQSMGMLDRTLSNLTLQRGVVGAFQSRLGVALNTLQSSREGYSAAESRIRDVDIAEATSSLVRSQILQKAATSVLSQANQLPQLALQLLT